VAETNGIKSDDRKLSDAKTNGLDEQVVTKEAAKSKTRLVIGIVIVVIIAAVFGVRCWEYASSHVSTDDAALTSDVIQISPQVSGTVQKVLVEDNQIVKAGDLLVVLDDSTYKAAVEQAKANLDAAIAQAKGAGVNVALTAETGNAQIQQAHGIVEQAQSAIFGAQAEMEKSGASLETAKANVRSAEANVRTAHASVNMALANKRKAAEAVRSSEALIESIRAKVKAAQAVYEEAARDAHRYSLLVAKGAVSKQMADDAESAALTAKAQEEEQEAVLAERKADLSAARQQLEAADAAIEESRAQLAASREQATAAHTGVSAAIAQQKAAGQGVRQASAKHVQAIGQFSQASTAPRQVAVSRSAQVQAEAKIEQARAALASAQLQLGYTKIYAPVSGRISKKAVEVGALVQPGAGLTAIVPENDVWVVANFKETQLVHVRQGQESEVEVDGIPGRVFKGHVDSLSSATGSTFALLPPDNATGNFVKVVQRVPVKIVLDANQPEVDLLRAGMSVTAAIRTR
jgi:membrane fusion protein (multidrug efflux system)